MNFFSRLFGPNDVGIDLGGAKVRVWVRDEGLVLDEPTADRSFRAGVVPDFDTTRKALRHCFAKVGGFRLRRRRVVITVQTGITEAEKRILEDAAQAAGAKEVFLIESPMAAAIGAGLPVSEPKGCMLVAIGASMTTIAVISLAGIVHSKTLHVGGDAMDNCIINYLKREYNAIMEYMRTKHGLVIGEQEAENIKIKIGTAFKPQTELEYDAKGLDAVDGRELSVTINSREIREEALAGVLGQIEGALKELLGITEPELAADLVDSGFVLTGGCALLRGLDKRLANVTGLSATVADDPLHAAIEGVNVVLGELDFLSKVGKG